MYLYRRKQETSEIKEIKEKNNLPGDKTVIQGVTILPDY
jgi:hypothetical protein